jgi:ankyrin repeat protein
LAGADPGAKDKRQQSALHKAVNNANVLRLLLDAGAPTDTRDASGLTPLMDASWHGHLDAVQLLLKAGADLDARSATGASALTLAARHGHPVVVAHLLQAGADVESKNEAGESALWLSAPHAAVVAELQALMPPIGTTRRC